MNMLSEATGKPSVCRSLVYKWHRPFSNGRNSTEDDSRSGRPGLINAGLVDSLRDVIEEDCRVSIRELSDRIGVGKQRLMSF